jgi:putative transposase
VVRDLAVLFLHLLTTVVRLAGPGGARSVVAESVLVKQQLLILNRSRKRCPNLRLSDRMVAGVCALFMLPRWLIRSAIVIKPSTLLNLHRALTQQKYRRLFSSKGPTKHHLVDHARRRTADKRGGRGTARRFRGS